MHKIGLILAIPLGLAAVGCQKSPGALEDRPYEPGDPGTFNPGEPGDLPEDMGTEPRGTDGAPVSVGPSAAEQYGENVPAPIRALQDQITAMREDPEFNYSALAEAVRSLADATNALPNGGPNITDAASRIRSYADRIEAAGATSDMQARWTKRAFKEGQMALENYQKDLNLTGMQPVFDTLSTTLDRLRDDQSFTDQKNAFADGYEQIYNALAVASTMKPEPVRGTE